MIPHLRTGIVHQTPLEMKCPFLRIKSYLPPRTWRWEDQQHSLPSVMEAKLLELLTATQIQSMVRDLVRIPRTKEDRGGELIWNAWLMLSRLKLQTDAIVAAGELKMQKYMLGRQAFLPKLLNVVK